MQSDRGRGSAARCDGDGWRGGSQVDRKATERVYAGKDTEGVEDGPDIADMEELGKGMCMTQVSTGASHYSAKY